VIGVLFLVLAVAALLLRPSTFPYLLGASIAFPHTAAIVASGNGLNPFYLLAIIAFGRLLFLTVVRRDRRVIAWLTARSNRGIVIALGVLSVYSAAISLVGPLLFGGIPVFSARGGLDEQVGSMSPLGFSVSNIAQIIYLALGIMVVLYLVTEPKRTTLTFDVGMWVGIGLALFSWVLPAAWPAALLENMPNVDYATTASRLRGTFSEASLFGLFLAASLAYAICGAIVCRGRRRVAMIAAAIVAAIEIYPNASWTAYATIGILAGLAAVLGVITLVIRLKRIRPHLAVLGLTVGVVVIVNWATILRLFGGLIDNKLETDSFHNRTTSNAAAFSLFQQTWGIGVGLGSNRPSSIFALLVSCVGIVGTVSFIVFIFFAILRGARLRATWPIAAALLATVIAEIVAAPELSMPILWLSAGLALWKSGVVASDQASVAAATEVPVPQEVFS
jgi:hypothetical protein